MHRVPIVMITMLVMLVGCESLPWERGDSSPVAELDPMDEASASDEGNQEEYEAPVLPEPGLPLATEQRFSDVPLPAGAEEDAERTYVYESRTLQVGRMVYKSRATVNELAQFYIREAPTTDWELDSVTQADNGTELVFSKPGKRLRVSIRDLGFTRGRRLVLHLTPDENPAPGS